MVGARVIEDTRRTQRSKARGRKGVFGWRRQAGRHFDSIDIDINCVVFIFLGTNGILVLHVSQQVD